MGEIARRPSVRHTPLHRCIASCSGMKATCGRCLVGCIWRRGSIAFRSIHCWRRGGGTVHCLVAMLRAGVAAQGGPRCVAHPRAICAEGATEPSKQSRSGPAESRKQQQKKRDRRDACSQKFAPAFHRKVAFGCTALGCAATALPPGCTLAPAHPPPSLAAFWPPCVTALFCLAFGSAALQFPTDARQHRPPFAPPSPSLPAPRQHPSTPFPPGDAVTHTLFRYQPPRRASLHSFPTNTLSIPTSRRVRKLVTMARDRLAAMRVSSGRQHRTSHAVMTEPHLLVLYRPNKRVVTAVTAAVTTATETTPTRHRSSSNRLRAPTTSRPTPTASHRPTLSPSRDMHHLSRAMLRPSRPDTDRCPRRSQQATPPLLLPEPTRTRCRTS